MPHVPPTRLGAGLQPHLLDARWRLCRFKVHRGLIWSKSIPPYSCFHRGIQHRVEPCTLAALVVVRRHVPKHLSGARFQLSLLLIWTHFGSLAVPFTLLVVILLPRMIPGSVLCFCFFPPLISGLLSIRTKQSTRRLVLSQSAPIAEACSRKICLQLD